MDPKPKNISDVELGAVWLLTEIGADYGIMMEHGGAVGRRIRDLCEALARAGVLTEDFQIPAWLQDRARNSGADGA